MRAALLERGVIISPMVSAHLAQIGYLTFAVSGYQRKMAEAASTKLLQPPRTVKSM